MEIDTYYMDPFGNKYSHKEVAEKICPAPPAPTTPKGNHMTDERLSEIELFYIADTAHSRTIRELAAEVRRLRETNERLRAFSLLTNEEIDGRVQIKLPPIG